MKTSKSQFVLYIRIILVLWTTLLVAFLIFYRPASNWLGWLIPASDGTAPTAAPGTEPVQQAAPTLLLLPSDTPFTEVNPTPVPALRNQALLFDAGEFVRLGAGPGLGSTTFTIETWFKRTGVGSASILGDTGNLVIPLVSKGFAENDREPASLNYFLGIQADNAVLLADFTEASGQTEPGFHHSIQGVTQLQEGGWYHAAVTFDGEVLRLYLDGNLENIVRVGLNRLPASIGMQYTGLAAALNARGEQTSFFSGMLDETRIWNYALSQAEVQGQINLALETAPGLIGRWSFDEGSGQIVGSSAGSRLKGVVHAQHPNWTEGASFNKVFLPPRSPENLSIKAGSAYRVDLAWDDSVGNETGFEIERTLPTGASEILAAVPVNAAGYQDWQAIPETEYCYRVRAVNLQGVSEYSPQMCTLTPAEAETALTLVENGAHILIQNPPNYSFNTFSVETWFRWTGSGIPYSTGPGGLERAVPLVTYGGFPSNGTGMITGWSLAIDINSGTLAADFMDRESSQHHTVYGARQVSPGGWHHAAATYDGSSWRIYLDGQLEAVSDVYLPLQYDPAFQIGLGFAPNSDSSPLGLFNGDMDEVRVWDRARSHAQILADMNRALKQGDGLLARWGFGEGEGSLVHDSMVGKADGMVVGAAASWLNPGAPFNIVAIIPPENPTLFAPIFGASDIGSTQTLQVSVDDVNRQDLRVSFYGRPVAEVPDDPFTFALIPDTQYYTLSDAAIKLFEGQTNWIVSNQNRLNIQFVSHLGDITEHGNIEDEWQRASRALEILDHNRIRYSIIPGNHDMPEEYEDYDRFFPPNRYQGNDWYGGYLGDPNDGIPDFGVDRQYKDNYQLISVGKLDFIFVNLEVEAPQYVLDWASALLQEYSERLAVITTHIFLDANGVRPTETYVGRSGLTPAETVWQQLIYPNCNVVLVLNGHYPGEARRTDTNACGRPVHQLLQDYQFRDNAGNGWMRYMIFEPAQNEIEVFTYSTNLDQFEEDGDSRFTLPFSMEGTNPFAEIGSVVVPAGLMAEITWNNLVPGEVYEWYVVVSDGQTQTNSATWNFFTRP